MISFELSLRSRFPQTWTRKIPSTPRRAPATIKAEVPQPSPCKADWRASTTEKTADALPGNRTQAQLESIHRLLTSHKVDESSELAVRFFVRPKCHARTTCNEVSAAGTLHDLAAWRPCRGGVKPRELTVKKTSHRHVSIVKGDEQASTCGPWRDTELFSKHRVAGSYNA